MAINRVSTELVRYLGAEVSARNINGKLANVVSRGQGNEIIRPADSQRMLSTSLSPASTKIADFDAALGYFENRGATPLAARTMALVMVDAAKAQGLNVMSILNNSNQATVELTEAKTFNYINQLRDGSSQLSTSKITDNKKSMRARYLLG